MTCTCKGYDLMVETDPNCPLHKPGWLREALEKELSMSKQTPDEKVLDTIAHNYAVTIDRSAGGRIVWFYGDSVEKMRASLNSALRNPVIWGRVEGKWRQVK